MLHPTLAAVLHAIRSARAPDGVTTRIVAIDGPGGAGKSTLANLLGRELGASIIRTDDFASWDNPLDWWPTVIEKVLEPLARGSAARYTPTSWGDPQKAELVVEPGVLTLLEGVSASRAAFRPYLCYSIWVETSRDLRLRRGLERDGVDAGDDWHRWMAEEDAWIARERPAEHADVVLPGGADLWT